MKTVACDATCWRTDKLQTRLYSDTAKEKTANVSSRKTNIYGLFIALAYTIDIDITKLLYLWPIHVRVWPVKRFGSLCICVLGYV